MSLGKRDLRPGEVRIVPYPGGAPPKISLLLVEAEGALRCYWNVCCHIPIPLDAGLGLLDPHEHLICLTHGAEYRKLDGHCVAGPCEGEDLERVELEYDGDEVFAVI